MLAPPHDYKMIGKPDAYYKWSVTQDGFIKRAEGAIYGPLDSSDSTKTGVTIFDPRTALPTGVWPTKVKPLHNRFSDYKASLHGSQMGLQVPESSMGVGDITATVLFTTLECVLGNRPVGETIIQVREDTILNRIWHH